jgi:hypothetical protein
MRRPDHQRADRRRNGQRHTAEREAVGTATWTCAALGLALLAFCLSAPAAAQARHNAAGTPCATLQASVRQNGAATIATGPYVYDTYRAFCGGRNVRAVPAYLRTRDTAQCLVGYRCVESGETT